MKSFAVLGFAAAALAIPQTSTPAGCSTSTPGTFQITTVNVTSSSTKRDVEKRQLAGALTLSLSNGILKDQAGRQGYIAANYQFQFDAPIQAGAKQTSGFSLCSNNTLALGGSAIFYQCLSGNFYNLYSQSTGAQCIPIFITAVNKGTSGGVSQISDGQPQASSAKAVISQISDGQPQATTPATRVPVVTQISDGQPQASKPASGAPVVTQISDGQPQAAKPTSRVPVVTQISDGQPQASAPASRAPVVSQISDGQPQAAKPTSNATRTNTTSSLPQFTGAAATGAASVGALAAGLFGLFALL